MSVTWNGWREFVLGLGLAIDLADEIYGLFIFFGPIGIFLGWRR